MRNLFITNLHKKDVNHFTTNTGLFLRRKLDKPFRKACNLFTNANIIRVNGAEGVTDEEHYRNLSLEQVPRLGLWAYGMILMKRDDGSSRRAAYEKMKYVIEHGGNIIIYPEGYWNLADNGQTDERHLADGHNSECWLIQDINVGILRLAKETGCEIVPTILHYDEVGKKRCFAHRGKSFRVEEYDDIFAKKDELVHIMTNMYWELMGKYSQYSRADLEKEGKSLKQNWEELKEHLRSACDIERIGYRLDLADEKRIGKAKVIRKVTPK